MSIELRKNKTKICIYFCFVFFKKKNSKKSLSNFKKRKIAFLFLKFERKEENGNMKNQKLKKFPEKIFL